MLQHNVIYGIRLNPYNQLQSHFSENLQSNFEVAPNTSNALIKPGHMACVNDRRSGNNPVDNNNYINPGEGRGGGICLQIIAIIVGIIVIGLCIYYVIMSSCFGCPIDPISTSIESIRPIPYQKDSVCWPMEGLLPWEGDKTGKVDLALESLGGLIVSTRETKAVGSKVRIMFLGFIPIMAQAPPPPETIIRFRHALTPGDCWAFEGNQGNVVIQLAKPANITAVTLEHIHRSNDIYGSLDSAPKEFQIWGLNDYRCLKTTKRTLLGNFTFEPLQNTLQCFPTNTTIQERFSYIELEVLSNHGDKITCIYRFRVHGVTNLGYIDNTNEKGVCAISNKNTSTPQHHYSET